MRRSVQWVCGLCVGLLVGCSSSSKVTTVTTHASEGQLTGRVFDTAGQPLAGVAVTVVPASHSSAALANTAVDGSWGLYAPAGTVNVTLGALRTTAATLTGTAAANVGTSLGAVVLTPAGAAVAGNLAPKLTNAVANAQTLGTGGNLLVSVNVADTDTPLGQLTGVAYVYSATGELLLSAPLTPAGSTFTATLHSTLSPATPLAASIRVSVGDPLSGLCAVADAGHVTLSTIP